MKLPIKSDAVFDYEERYHRPSGPDANSVVTMAERFYHEAHSRSRLNRNAQSCQLRDSVRETIVRREMLPEVIYARRRLLSARRTGIASMPASSMAVDELLPSEAVMSGSRVHADSRLRWSRY